MNLRLLFIIIAVGLFALPYNIHGQLYESKGILNAFIFVDNGVFKTTENLAAKIQVLYSEFDKQMTNNPVKTGPWRDKALNMRAEADQLVLDMQKLKIDIVKLCDGAGADALIPVKRKILDKESKQEKEVNSYDIDDVLLADKGNLDTPGQIMIVDGKGAELKERIDAFRELVLSLTSDKHPEIKASLEKSLDTNPPPKTKDGIQQTWESNYFDHIPAIAALTMLAKLQNDVRNAEAEIVEYLLSEI